MKTFTLVEYKLIKKPFQIRIALLSCLQLIFRKEEKMMSFNLNRINPNQTQVMFFDGRFETLTNEELEELLSQTGISEKAEEQESSVTS
jgi:hypothetical protein